VSEESEQESFGIRSTRLPRRKLGSIVPPRELVVAGKLLQLLEKFGAAEPWVPAFAGKREQKLPIFHLDLDTCPASQRIPPQFRNRKGSAECAAVSRPTFEEIEE
jgi:hypothetical protein